MTIAKNNKNAFDDGVGGDASATPGWLAFSKGHSQ
jgi:hypothetical protein